MDARHFPSKTAAIPATLEQRWRLIAMMLVMVAAAHFNRLSISVAGAESIIPHQGVEPTQMGWVYSAYLLMYTLMMSPGGWFIDRFGAQRALFVVGAGSAVFVALTGFAGILWSGMPLLIGLLLIRGAMGIFNAPTHPGSARLVGDWVPPGNQSLINGVTNFAACVGMSVTYLLFGALIDRYDWTGASFIAGGGTIVLAVIWLVCAPRRTVPAANVPAEPQIALPIMLHRIRSLWFLTISYAALGYFQYLFFYWAEYYFEQVRNQSKEDSRLYTSILTLAMGIGMIVGGWLTDALRRRHAHPRAMALVPVIGLVTSALVLLPGLFSESPLVTVLSFAAAMAAAGSSEGAFWTLAVELGGKRGGLAAGILNTGGNAGGLVAPILTPYVSAWLGWRAGLGLASVVCLIGALCWLGIDPNERREK